MVWNDSPALGALRRQWLWVAFVYAAALGIGAYVLQQTWTTPEALRWIACAGVVMVAQLVILWRVLATNHPPGVADTPFPDLGLANGLTLARGLLTALLAGFLFGPTPTGLLAWAPAILYTVERLIDFADGYVARVTRRETRLGEILDIEFDGLGILVAVALGIQYGKLPFWYLILGLGRQLFILGIWLRERNGKPVFPLPPSDNRRVIAGFQTGFISVVLWPIWTAQLTLLASYVFAIPLIFSFGRDWLVVSGALDANSAAYAAARRRGKQIVEGWLPLGARILVALLAVGMLAQITLGVLYGDSASWPVLGLLLLVALAIGAVLLGAAGRVAALIVAAFAAIDIVATGMQADNATLLVCAIIVLHLGSGRFALWRPEERPLHSKLGAQSPGSE